MIIRQFVAEGGIRVYYEPELGGGNGFGRMFVPVLKRLGLGGTCYEPFSGPAFIGFSLLGSGICDELVVSDVNPRAIECVKLTIELNGLGDRVKYYVSNLLEDIPRDLRFDLVVANPPHYKDESSFRRYVGGYDDIDILKGVDRDFALHRAFYHGIGDHLKSGGSVVFVESSYGSSPQDFATMITESGLRFRGAIKPSPDDSIYALKGMAKNYMNTHSISIGIRGLYRLVGSLIILTSPSTLLKHAPLPSNRWIQKFYFTWASKD